MSATPCKPQDDMGVATRYSLVIPVYKNEGTIDRLLEALADSNRRLDGRLEVVFVVDGSPDRSYALLKERLPGQSFSSELVCLSRNFGSFSAIRMGLSIARGPYFAVMAADLQEPPELILDFFHTLAGEPVDMVLGVRTDRDDPLLSKASSNLFWAIYRRWVQREMPAGGIDIFACNAQVRDALLSLEESNSSLVGQLIWLGFRKKCISYRRQPRLEGKSAWTFRRKLRYMFDSIYAFTDLPLTLLTLVGSLGIVVSVVLAAVILCAWLAGAIPVPGYTPIILAVLMSSSCQLLGLGVVGAYIWRTFENTKHRPNFIPMLRDSYRREVSRRRHDPPVDSDRGRQATSVGDVTLHSLKSVADLRGNLSVGKFGEDIPFEARRYFIVFDVPSANTRGEHAHRHCQQFLVCVKGTVTVIVDNGHCREEIVLDRPDLGLYIPPLVWAAQYQYSSDAVLLVFASDPYDPADYIREYDQFLAILSAGRESEASSDQARRAA